MNFTTETQLRAEIARVWSMLKAERSAINWQPIETAPRDGTDILVFQPQYGECFCAFYNSGCWWQFSLLHVLKDEPTHWMPLPEPPTQ